VSDGVVLKYGGTSVGDILKIQQIANKLAKRWEKQKKIVVVVSAMGKQTDKLIEMAENMSKKPCLREMDMLLSTGEQQSIALLSMAIKEKGIDAISLTGAQAGILTSGKHTKNAIRDINTQNIIKHLDNNKIVVIAGFQGVNENGDITTLGRGGSDTSAVALAAKLNFDCEIYSDVDGIFTVDPRIYKNAKKRNYISYDEMMELSSLGAKVLESRAVLLAKKYNVPLYVGNAHIETNGTWIKEVNDVEIKGVTGLSISDEVIINHLYPIENQKKVAKVFDILGKLEINIDMISQQQIDKENYKISFTCPKNQDSFLEAAMEEINSDLGLLNNEKLCECIQISLVGLGMRTRSGVASKAFKILSDENIEYKMITTSEISITYAVLKQDADRAVQALARGYSL